MEFKDKQSLANEDIGKQSLHTPPFRSLCKQSLASFAGKKVAVLGYGLEGKDATKYLLEKKAKVFVYDKKPKSELEITGLKNKVEFICGEKYLDKGLSGFDFIVRSPGFYRYLKSIVEAEEGGTHVTSATKLFFDLCPAKIIGITGTKGKGTTSTLIYEILKKEGFDVHLAGNIGYPMLKLLTKLKPSSWVVLELSSFQLIDMTKSPDIAVVLNITTDHLDWHKDRNEYLIAKRNIVNYQSEKDYAVLNFDYKDSKSFANFTKAKSFYFSKGNKVSGSYIKNNKIILEIAGRKREIGNISNLLLRGKHNWENINAAVTASFLAGTSIQSIKDVIFTFKGLEHRLELVDEIKGIGFYNDSFSTNPQTTIAAIKSFEEPITLILGGFDKGLNYDGLARVIKKSNVVNVILIGDISGKIAGSLKKAKFDRIIVKLGKPAMSSIIKKCFELTPKNGVVLLSPATSSFDMFSSYKERGKMFKETVITFKKQRFNG